MKETRPVSGEEQQLVRRRGELAIGRPIAWLIARLREAVPVVVARWLAGLDRALRYMGGVRA